MSSKHHLPTTIGTILLQDPQTGRVRCIMDGEHPMAVRTGAASAVATKLCSPFSGDISNNSLKPRGISRKFMMKQSSVLTLSRRRMYGTGSRSNPQVLLQDLVERLQKEFHSSIISVVLFGSAARGSASERSDLDVLIIYDEEQITRRAFRDGFLAIRKNLMSELMEASGCTDIFTLPLLSSLLMSCSEADDAPYVLLDIVADGIVLFDPKGFFARTKKRILRRLRYLGARRVFLEDGTWYWNLKPDAKLNERITI